MRRGRELGSMGAAALLVLAGCGGGTRQDAHEVSGDFKVQIVSATFPATQSLAQPSQMQIAVRNADSRAIPDVAVTVDSFTRRAQGTADADPTRPIWIVDHGPFGGDTAYNGTWALGALAPGQTKTFKWRVTAIEAGKFALHYRVNAGLNGKALAKLEDGSAPLGVFNVRVSNKPGVSRVDPNTGRVIHAPAPRGSGSGTTPSSSRAGSSGGTQSGTATTPPPPGY